MCAVSAVGDYWTKRLPEKYPERPWDISPPQPTSIPGLPNGGQPWNNPPNSTIILNGVDKTEFEKLKADFETLKKEMEEIKLVLLSAKKYDEKYDEPHCEMDEKVELLKKIAEYVGVDLSTIFDK